MLVQPAADVSESLLVQIREETSPPRITPQMLPIPPRMTMQRMKIEMLKKKSSGKVPLLSFE